MSNLVDYAKDELKRIGMIDSGEAYNDLVTKAILDLIELFASQGHSGSTAPYVIGVFSRLAMFKPLSPLTGEDDEWDDIGDGFQNKRYSAVFKDKDGTAYNIDGKVFTDDGEVWYTCEESNINVTFPYAVPDKPEYVYRNKKDKDLDIINLQTKTGHWIEVDTNMYACSNCSHCFSIVPEDNSIKQYHYCPNCKAKMSEISTSSGRSDKE